MEKKIVNMEQKENELLDRLKRSQQLEMNEFSKLEEAIRDSNEAYNKRKSEYEKVQKVRPKPVEENDTLAFSEMMTTQGTN